MFQLDFEVGRVHLCFLILVQHEGLAIPALYTEVTIYFMFLLVPGMDVP